MQRLVAALVATLLTSAGASAQSYPGDPGAGTQRGIAQLNNSGQVGTVTLFRSRTSTRIVIAMEGTPPSRAQSVRLYRGPDCDTLSPAPTYFLADLHGGLSRSIVAPDEDKLLSGNYNVVVFANNKRGAPASACGHLYR